MTFSDCKGNNKLHYEVSSPYFKVNNDGSLVALKNVTAVGKTLFIHARTPHAEDMAELVIVGGKDIQGSLQVTQLFGINWVHRGTLGSVCLMWKIVLGFIIGQDFFVVAKDNNPTQKPIRGRRWYVRIYWLTRQLFQNNSASRHGSVPMPSYDPSFEPYPFCGSVFLPLASLLDSHILLCLPMWRSQQLYFIFQA